MRNPRDLIESYAGIIERLQPGMCYTISGNEIDLLAQVPLAGIFGPLWSPVDMIMENIVGSSYSILVHQSPKTGDVTFRRLDEPTDGERLTYVSPDRRDRFVRQGEYWVRKGCSMDDQ